MNLPQTLKRGRLLFYTLVCRNTPVCFITSIGWSCFAMMVWSGVRTDTGYDSLNVLTDWRRVIESTENEPDVTSLCEIKPLNALYKHILRWKCVTISEAWQPLWATEIGLGTHFSYRPVVSVSYDCAEVGLFFVVFFFNSFLKRE